MTITSKLGIFLLVITIWPSNWWQHWSWSHHGHRKMKRAIVPAAIDWPSLVSTEHLQPKPIKTPTWHDEWIPFETCFLKRSKKWLGIQPIANQVESNKPSARLSVQAEAASQIDSKDLRRYYTINKQITMESMAHVLMTESHGPCQIRSGTSTGRDDPTGMHFPLQNAG